MASSNTNRGGLGLLGVTLLISGTATLWKCEGWAFDGVPWWGVWMPVVCALIIDGILLIGAVLGVTEAMK